MCARAGVCVWRQSVVNEIFLSDCGLHPEVGNGNVSGDTFFGGLTNLSCIRGYLPQGSAICQEDGRWKFNMTCIPIGDCVKSKT